MGMITGSIPPTSVHGTWVETLEVVDITNDMPWDWGSIVEATVMLRWPQTGSASLGHSEMTLKKSRGNVFLPTAGILQWRAEASQMATMASGLYEVLVILEDSTDTVPIIIGSIAIIQ